MVYVSDGDNPRPSSGKKEQSHTNQAALIGMKFADEAIKSLGITPAVMKRCHWVKPVLLAQIKFTEWTHDNQLSFLSRAFWGYEPTKRRRTSFENSECSKLTSKEAISLRPSWIFWESMIGSSSSVALRREFSLVAPLTAAIER